MDIEAKEVLDTLGLGYTECISLSDPRAKFAKQFVVSEVRQ